MLELSLDPDQGVPLVDQIVDGVRRHVEDRLLRPGTQVPPIRRLAATHGVSRFTVVEAYDRLVALGYLHSRRGAGFFVALRATPALETSEAPIDRAIDVVWLLRQSFEQPTGPKLKAGSGWLPPEWMDDEGLRRNVRSLTRREDVRLTRYGTPQGYLPLRQQLQIKLGEIGIAAEPAQIVLTLGATQALDLVARHFLKAGDCVFVDDPGYWTLFGNLRMQGARLVGVPRTPDGPDIEALRQLLQQHQPKAFFTHSALHNPTAANLSPAIAHQVLKLADQHGFVIVEDDTYCDFQPRPTTRLAALDQLERVIYVGSFAKTLSADFRVGFLACHGDLAGVLTDAKLLASLPTSEFAERLVHSMLVDGHYRKYLERVRGRLAQSTAATLRMLERANLELYAEPCGGMFAWARLPGLADAARLANRGAVAGIVLAPGNVFRPQMQPSPWLRFNVAFANDRRLERFLAEAQG